MLDPGFIPFLQYCSSSFSFVLQIYTPMSICCCFDVTLAGSSVSPSSAGPVAFIASGRLSEGGYGPHAMQHRHVKVLVLAFPCCLCGAAAWPRCGDSRSSRRLPGGAIQFLHAARVGPWTLPASSNFRSMPTIFSRRSSGRTCLGLHGPAGALRCSATIWLRGRADLVDRSRVDLLNPVAMRRAPGHACSPHHSTDCALHVQTTKRQSVARISEETGIHVATLYVWRKGCLA